MIPFPADREVKHAQSKDSDPLYRKRKSLGRKAWRSGGMLVRSRKPDILLSWMPRGGVAAEVVKGVHLIETYANCALYTDGRLVLVDSGEELDARDIFAYFREIRHSPTDLASIVVTHEHPDHVGGLAALKSKEPGAKVAAHRDDADYVARTKVYPWPPGPQTHRAVDVDVRLEDGQRYEGFIVIHTPGHTPGSIALLDTERKILVAGDSIENSPELGPLPDGVNVDPRQHRRSIKKLAEYDYDVILFGHGPPIMEDGRARVAAPAAKL